MTVRIGIDTGGTFTDVILFDESTAETHVTKTPSTPPNFDEGVLNGLEKILDQTETDSDRVSFLSHGTTVGTNAVLEGEIPKLGLITNEGLRDVLEIGDQTRPDLYDLQTEKPPALIPRHLRRGVPGRVDSTGTVVEELDPPSVESVVEELVSEDVESIVVSMLFSYLEPSQEREVGEIIEEIAPHTDYTLSSTVHPEIREYERTITTVLNEAIKRQIEDYLQRLNQGIADRGVNVPLNIVHSGGGIFTANEAIDHAIRTVTSGPAAGAVATKKVATKEGYRDAIGLDMGGTSADVSLVRDGEIVRSTEGEVNDLPIKTPMIDINTVGAGGGSIAWVDEGDVLHVGPESAGADPGPICYGKGGTEPTITDANLLLGRINPDNFLSGEMDLRIEKTRELFRDRIADPLGQSVEEAALAVVAVANASIARRVHNVTVERGDDPADFALVGFGGAGPLQTPAVADRMDMETVLIPRSPGVFSARGILMADVRIDESRAYGAQEIQADRVESILDELSSDVRERLDEQKINPEQTTVQRAVDVRYAGQSYELTVPIEGEAITPTTIEETIQSFHDKHARLYGHSMSDEPVEFVTLRVTGRSETEELSDEHSSGVPADPTMEREVYFEDQGWVDTSFYTRTELVSGQSITGPAILEEEGSTTLVPPDAEAVVSDVGNILVSL